MALLGRGITAVGSTGGLKMGRSAGNIRGAGDNTSPEPAARTGGLEIEPCSIIRITW